jgi:N-acetyl-anhydromuramyl-L-alanine amidase AmpD
LAVRVPATEWVPISRIVHGRRTYTKGVVIHTIEGSDEGATSWFRDPDAGGVGAHLVIGHTPPRAVQLCDLDALCWHAKSANSFYIGIEHEGKASDSRATWIGRRTQRVISANRVAWICWHYKLGQPTKGKNVFGHNQFPAGGHTDPGRGWPWDLYMEACRRAYTNLRATNGREWRA